MVALIIELTAGCFGVLCRDSAPSTPPAVDGEYWTGNYLFENEWQSFRTKRNPKLEFISMLFEYKASGRYKIMVKVVDILGIDTSKIIEINV